MRLALLLAYILSISRIGAQVQTSIQAPTIWDDQELLAMTLPPALPEGQIVYLPAAAYYKFKVTPVYKTYPVYHPAREPKGYMEWLRRQESAVAFDASKLKSEADWVRAGEITFRSPGEFG